MSSSTGSPSLISGSVALLFVLFVQVIECRPPSSLPFAFGAVDPEWPTTFTSKFKVLIEEYGSEWESTGIVYYDWNKKAFRSDFIDWCLPLFDEGQLDQNNYTCSFLAIDGNLYFVNHTSTDNSWEENDCCLFAKGLGAVAPDWMKIGLDNGTAEINDVLCRVFWFPGTKDPSEPCYGYWSSVEDATPCQFFGLSSIGPAILQYFGYRPHFIPSEIMISQPNPVHCKKECEPPSTKMRQKTIQQFIGIPAQSTSIPRPHNYTASSHVEDWPFKWPECG